MSTYVAPGGMHGDAVVHIPLDAARQLATGLGPASGHEAGRKVRRAGVGMHQHLERPM